ncbi:MAG: S41 family peptidase [Intestinimonas sp.]
MERLVFDVRNNGGGYLDELTTLLDYLLPEGTIFRSEDKAGASEQRPVRRRMCGPPYGGAGQWRYLFGGGTLCR